MLQSIKTKAIILRRTNFGETDRILQVLTQEGQKLSIMAKGVRKEKSKNAGAVELFCVSSMTIRTGKGSIGTLTSARLEIFYRDILEDYERLQFGYEILKQTNKLSEHIHEPSLYSITQTGLESLNQLSIDIRVVKAWYFLQIADISGHGLNLSRDIDGRELSSESIYRFDISEMAFSQDVHGVFTSEHLKLLKILKLKTPNIISKVSGIEGYLDDIVKLAYAIAE